ncbi:MAG: molybdenum cofactor guanylyltransferase [Solirubrobacteraceae bacterium]
MNGSAIVLAGGRGMRIGGAKAVAQLAGRPLVAHVVEAARAGKLAPIVVAKADSVLPQLDCPIVIEPPEPTHPLLGIVTGLRALAGSAAVVCPTDMPLVTGELLAWLASLDEPLAVVRAGGRIQPLLGRYARGLLDALELELAAAPSLTALVTRLGARIVEEDELRPFGDPARLLLNVNTADDLANAEG